MLSRVAENIYWMSRYMERSNIHLRVLNSIYISDQDGLVAVNWEQIARHFSLDSPKMANGHDVLPQLIFHAQEDFSILNNVFKSRENARSAQDHINRELWQSLNDFYHLIREKQLQVLMAVDPISVMDQLIKQTLLFDGVIHNSMNRGEAFCFLQMGKLVERGLQIIDLLKYQITLDESLPEKTDDQRWRYLLIALNGYETYLREHVGNLDPDLVFEQIISKSNFPHSLHFSWAQITSFLQLMKKEEIGLHHPKLTFIIGKAFSYIQYIEVPATNEGRIQYLNTVQDYYLELNRVLNNDYFGNIY
ncbi:alpha-E domain-containing protein [Sphingobacterium sp. LRF_L2]|uniref:alpha-E domain-containing protein n=1 Tax=Sphingobacterium sp. LRF_L2 TaxID=3369421 RepID=UPI003F5E6DE3